MVSLPRPRTVARHAALRSLHVRNYRLYTLGSFVSGIGTWLQFVAQNWLVLRLTGSPAIVGITVALQLVPSAVLGLLGGVVADRMSRRTLLLRLQAVWIALALTVGTLILFGAMQVWMMFVAAVVAGLVSAVEGPANTAFGPELVGRENLANAIAIGSVVSSGGRILGMALAGVVMASAGPAAAFFLNAATFLAVVAALLAMRPSELRSVGRAPKAPGLSQLREGVAHVVSSPVLLTTVALAGALSLFGRNYQVTMAAMSAGPLRAGAGGYGLASTAFGIGAVLGAVWAARLPRARIRFLLGAAAVTGVLQFLAAFSPTIEALVALVLPIAAGAVVIDTMTVSLTQLATHDVLRGRVAAVVGLASTGGAAVGAVFLGWIADAAGPRAALACGGLLVLGAVVAGAYRLNALRDPAPALPEPVAQAA